MTGKAMTGKGSGYTPEQINAMLIEWGKWEGVTNIQAAAHLLTATSLAQSPEAVTFLFIRPVWDRDASTNIKVASVINWDALLGYANYWDPGELNLLRLAQAFVEREPVPLVDCLTGLDFPQVRRVMEAVAICTGYDAPGWLSVTVGPDLQRHDRQETPQPQGGQS